MIIFSAGQSENDRDGIFGGLLEITLVQTKHINKEFKAEDELKDDLIEDSSWKVSWSFSNIQSHYNLVIPRRNSVSILIWIRFVLLK